MSSATIKNALSVDVEEYFQVSAFEQVIDRSRWEAWPSRVEAETNRLLDLFGREGVRITFFVLGWVAERYPGIVRRMVDEGHEVGCHGYAHARLTTLSPDALAEELDRSKDLVEQVSGEACAGFRAASFSIDRTNLWAFGAIERAGFVYSSSVYPVRHDLYGIPNAPRGPFQPPGTDRLVEIPVTTARIGRRNVPAGGGGYFRLFPYAVSRHLLRRVNDDERMSANMYFHPWEFDPDQPRPDGVPFKSRFRHYLNQGRALDRLGHLLRDFSWAPFREVYEDVLSGERTPEVADGLVANA